MRVDPDQMLHPVAHDLGLLFPTGYLSQYFGKIGSEQTRRPSTKLNYILIMVSLFPIFYMV